MINQTILSLYKKFLTYGLVSTDSRKIIKNSIFFALKGENFDGNKFAQDALDIGSLYSVIDDNTIKSRSDKFILVDNSLNALQDLAKIHRDNLSIPVIGLTGSNGKTTTKSLLAECLKSKYVTYSTKGNLNNHIGVPLSVLSVTENDEIAIIEKNSFITERGYAAYKSRESIWSFMHGNHNAAYLDNKFKIHLNQLN